MAPGKELQELMGFRGALDKMGEGAHLGCGNNRTEVHQSLEALKLFKL